MNFIGALLGFGSCDILGALLAPLLACCAIFGVYKCMNCRLRDCGCMKRWFRVTGVDVFDDFELFVVAHEALYTASTHKLSTFVRLSAGRQKVSTDASSRGIFQQPLSLFVEQGTDTILVELMDSGSRVLANLKFNVAQDILNSKEAIREKLFTMKQKNKGLINPRIRLTIRKESAFEEEGLLANVVTGASPATNMLLRDQLEKEASRHHQESSSGPPLSETELLAKSCAGRLELFGDWGKIVSVFVAVLGPPQQKKHVLGIWDDQQQYQKGARPKTEVDLMKVLSVQPDPARSEVFLLNYVKADKTRTLSTFRRVDRSRDVWVEMISLLIKKLREDKETKKKPMCR